MMVSTTDAPRALPLDEGVKRARTELEDLLQQLEPTLTPHQSSLLHQIRLASESLALPGPRS